MGLMNLFKGKINKGLLIQGRIEKIKDKPLPKHIAIIMDGNGRWAVRKGLPRTVGHRYGVEALKDVIRLTAELDIPYLTLYAFSTENWKRTEDEIQFLMLLLVEYLRKEIKGLHDNGIRINILGELESLPPEAREEVINAVELTKENTGLQVNIALNYGGRFEIIRGVKSIVSDVQEGKINSNDIDEELFSKYLYTKDMPDPDLLIRTGGEYRLSNFLLYQIAYTEFWFTPSDVYWPDFNRDTYIEAIITYQGRQRRYGGVALRKGE